MGCLEENLVVAFAEGRLDPDAMLTANTHAGGCQPCHDRLVHALKLSVTARSTAGHAFTPLSPLSPLSPPNAPAIAGQVLAAGTAIGRYTVLGLVGRGGMGQVYSAYDPQLDRRIALKLMHAEASAQDERAQERLLREAQSMARLSHTNVIVVHDVGTFGDRVFVAMEFVDGDTLAMWAKHSGRTWQDILDVYLQAARGLAAAHRAGLVHRDFKPQNVMVSRQGAVRVMDFGLARRIEGPSDLAESFRAVAPQTPGNETTLDLNLTRPGERLGTPRYMAPEQFRNEPVDARSDQFAFCVALFEALYGAHPFDDDNHFSLSVSVTHGDLRPLPKDRDVPGWLRRVVLRGLAVNPDHRHASMAALVSALESDPAVGRRRRLVAAAFVGVTVASLLGARQIVTRRHAELDRRVDVALTDANGRARAAHDTAQRVRTLRADAFAAFDDRDSARGEKLWRQTLPLAPRADAEYQQAERAFETALLLDTTRSDARDRLGDVVLEHLRLAEELGLDERVRALQEALVPLDPTGKRAALARAPGLIDVRVHPASATLELERYELDVATLRRTPRPAGPLARGSNALAPGSYRLTLRGDGLTEVLFPFVVSRGQPFTIDVTVPPRDAVPKGFVFVPAGPFLYGEADERLRRGFLQAVPLHRRSTGAFLIAREETTFREWIAFLDALPPAERKLHTPRVSAFARGALQLRELADGWQLSIQPAVKRYEARAGQPIEYVGRRTRALQDWLSFPVGGVSLDDAERYVAWLNATGRVPGARLCTELEWERAARGADERSYPNGDELDSDDANIDITYDRVDTAYGPDEVGSHPLSRSPFGVDDLAGNMMELVRPIQAADELVMRGGAYIMEAATARTTNRAAVPRTFQDVIGGVRVCATPAAPSR